MLNRVDLVCRNVVVTLRVYSIRCVSPSAVCQERDQDGQRGLRLVRAGLVQRREGCVTRASPLRRVLRAGCAAECRCRARNIGAKSADVVEPLRRRSTCRSLALACRVGLLGVK